MTRPIATRPIEPHPIEPKVPCRTPAPDRDGVTRIPAWKFNTVRQAVLDAVAAAEPAGLPFAALTQAVSERLLDGDRKALGSLGWHVTTVKLELECRNELRRAEISGPQRLHIANPTTNAPAHHARVPL